MSGLFSLARSARSGGAVLLAPPDPSINWPPRLRGTRTLIVGGDKQAEPTQDGAVSSQF